MSLVSSPKENDPVSIRQAIQKIASIRLGSGAEPTFAGLTLTGLTASRLISTDADKALASVANLASWIAGTTNQVIVTNDNDGTVTLSLPQNIHTGATPTFAGLTITNAVTEFSTDGTLGGNSDAALPTEKAVKTYVDLAIGISRDFFLSDNDDAVIANYHILYATDTGEATSTLTSSAMAAGNDQLMFSYITASGVPGVDTLRAGVYILHTHLHRGTGDKPTTFYWTVSKYTTGDVETVLLTSEESSAIPTSMISFITHAVLNSNVTIDVTDRLVLKLYANVGVTGGNSEVTITMEGTHDCHLTNLLPSDIWQTQGDVLDDLNTLGANAADSEFLVGTGEGALAWESGATARNSIGLGTGDSPTFATLTLTDLIVDTNLIKTVSGTNCVGINKTTPTHSLDVVGDVLITGPTKRTGGYVLEVIGGVGAVCENGQGFSFVAGDGGEGTAEDPSGDGGSIILQPGITGFDEGGGEGSDGIVSVIGKMSVSKSLTLARHTNVVFDQRSAGVVGIQNKSAGNMVFEIFTLDGDGDDYVGFNIWGYGTVGQETDRELLLVRYNPSEFYEVFSATAGTGTVRPIKLYTGDNTDQLVIATDGKIGIGLASPKTKLTIEGALTLKEQAAADGDTEAYGQIWVKTATPNVLMFTNDAGTDIQLQAQGDVLDDLNTLGANAADSEFLVGTGEGALAWESGVTVRTSLGLGTGDSPQFANIGLGINAQSRIHIQTTVDEGKQAIFLHQQDDDEAYIEYFGNSAEDVTRPITSLIAGNIVKGFFRVEINSVKRWMPFYDEPDTVGAIILPSERMDDYNHSNFTYLLNQIHTKNANIGFGVGTYTHGVAAEDTAYVGGVYSPTQNRIYLMPRNQGPETNWHYIDCSDGSINAYAHGATVVSPGYMGGVYSPTQNRIYLMPFGQTNETNWHYIDCSTGVVVAYAHGATVVDNGYVGGVYSPTQNRIYLVPFGQSGETNWHYIDCSDGTVNAYAHGATVASNYIGGVYSPTQNRIYLIPNGQSDEDNWHYIDCSDGSVVPYAHGATVVDAAYYGGVYSPTQNRIYLIPFGQAGETNWHYIDCSDGTVNAYAHGATVGANAYAGGVYSPTQNRIYLVPAAQADVSIWHYIDCSDGSVVAYTHGVTAGNNAYAGGVYSPTQNRIYLVPAAQADVSIWHYIQEYSTAEISPSIAASPLFNKL